MAPSKSSSTVGQKGDYEAIVSLRRGLQILRSFRADDSTLSQQELVSRTGLPKATVSRLIHTLLHLGYLHRHEGLNRYQLGVPVFALGRALLDGLPIRRFARPTMQRLADSLKASVAIGIGEGLEMLYLEYCAAEEAVPLRLGTGSLIPMATTAIGRAYLWGLPAPARTTAIRQIEQESGDQASLVLDGIQHAFRELDERGFCTSFGAWRREVYAVAAPLMFNNGRDVLALNCGVESLGLSDKFLYETSGPALLGAIKEIKNALGHGGSDDLGFGESWAADLSSPEPDFQ